MTDKESNDFIVAQFTNSAGNNFEVGYPKSEGYSEESLDLEINEQEKSIWKELRCRPNLEGFVSEDARSIGIKHARLISDEGATLYRYQLKFKNTKGWAFQFKDEFGDVYECYTIRNGWHYINYNSPKPTIVGVIKS